jgi:hypothetical protein
MSQESTRPSAGLGGAVRGWLFTLIGLGAVVAGAYFLGQQAQPTRIVSTGPRIEDVRRLARLAVLRVRVADIIEGTTAGARGLVIVKGDADIAIDLDRIEIVERDDERRTATVAIPLPRPDRPRVDQSQTRVYELRKVGLAAFNPFADPRADLLHDCMRAAQQAIEQAVQGDDLIARAREQAESLLTAFYRELGWSVTIQWKPPAATDRSAVARTG